MTIEEDKRKFCEYCKQCGGKCCKGDKDSIIPLSRKEAEAIKKKYPEIKIELGRFGKGRMHFFRLNGDCLFLGEKGCVLEKKPINCEMFPLIALYRNGELEFYFDDSNHCPYTKDIQKLKDWKKETLELSKSGMKEWNEEEKLFFSALCEIIEKLKKA